MNSRLHGVAYAAGALSCLAIAALIVIGCGNVNPFLATQFWTNANLDQLTRPNVTTPPEEETVDPGNLASVCDLDAGARTLQVTLVSESTQNVRFSMTFVASTGSGGFVCDDALQNYLNAGYNYRATGVIGCDTLSLGGTNLLAMEFGINQGAGATLTPTSNTLTLRRRDTLSASIPVPQVIVFGNADPDFECVGGAGLGDLCTQRGFVYATAGGVTTGKPIEASRIQGTLCNVGFGSAPEWRLDRTILDGVSLPYQYVHAGTITITIYDRSGDALSNTRLQAAWEVTGGTTGTGTIHYPDI